MGRHLVVALAIGSVLAGCGPAPSPSPSPSPSTLTPEPTAQATSTSPPTTSPAATAGAFDLTVVADGLDAPLDLDAARDGSGRILIAEQEGRVRILDGDELLDTPYLDIAERISAGGERGLLGIALHPEYPTDDRLFVHYTDVDGNSVVSSFEGSLDADAADPDSERIILQVEQPFPNHNGGALGFGNDGMLYISLGDGGGGGDPLDAGNRLDTHLAKILRIDIDVPPEQERAYEIPPDNPWADGRDGALPENWLTGLRNPWRMRFDRATGDLWIGDVGQGAREEIDVARAGVGGLDFGWNTMEGSLCFDPPEDCDQDGLTLPVAEYGRDDGCTVIGGVVARGPAVAALEGRYIYTDTCSGKVWSIDAASDGPSEPTLLMTSGRFISSIGQGPDGSILMTDLGAGEIVKLTLR